MDKIFPNGLIFKRPKDGAPEYVKGSLSVKADEFGAFIEKHKNEDDWLRLDLKESREGKLYFQLNTWKPEQASAPAPQTKLTEPVAYPEEVINPDDIPF